MKYHKVGKVRFTHLVEELEAGNAGLHNFLRDFAIMRQDFDSGSDVTTYIGSHPKFANVDVHRLDEAPEYVLTVNSRNGDYTVVCISRNDIEDESYIEIEEPKVLRLRTVENPVAPELGYEVLSNYVGDEPAYKHEGDSGFDLRAGISLPYFIPPMSKEFIPTGLKLQIPEGFEIQIRPRSGLAAKHSVTVLNTPGTIDRGYTGELVVILYNLGDDGLEVKPGDRIAQAVLAPVARAALKKTDTVQKTDERGQGGFGSTGIN